MKLDTILGCLGKNGKLGWKRRIVKDIIDIHLMHQNCNLDFKKLPEIFKFLTEAKRIKINFIKKDRLKNIIDEDPDFEKTLMKWINNADLQEIPIQGSYGLLEKIIKKIEPKEKLIKKTQEVKV